MKTAEKPTKTGEKVKLKLEKLVFVQIQDLIEREKRCDSNIREMERLLHIMRREREDIIDDRERLEVMLSEVHRSDEVPQKNLVEYGCRWKDLIGDGKKLLFALGDISSQSRDVYIEEERRKSFEFEERSFNAEPMSSTA